MLKKKMAPKLQRSEGYGRIPIFGRISARNPKFIKKETRILMFGKGNKKYNVSKDTSRIPRYTGIGTQFQCL